MSLSPSPSPSPSLNQHRSGLSRPPAHSGRVPADKLEKEEIMREMDYVQQIACGRRRGSHRVC